MSPLCEICQFGGFEHMEMNMVKCSSCKIYVHQECYFAATITALNEPGVFMCLACQAVGRKFQAVDSHMGSDFHMITQETRPQKCELCSISSVVTAMHPLYDYHERGARQVCRRNKDNSWRLAWGHTLCCYYLSYNGFLYGCDQNGGYNGEDDVRDPRPPNPTRIPMDKFVKIFGDVAIVQFRYYLPTKPRDEYRVAIYQRQDLQCFICGKSDKKNGSMRIPLQCCAGDDTELDWSQYDYIEGPVHPSLEPDCPCPIALHIGCARWGGSNVHRVKRVHFFPGHIGENDEEELQTTAWLYCTKHAEDVNPGFQKRLKEAAMEKEMVQQQKLKPKATTTNQNHTLPASEGIRHKSLAAPSNEKHTTTLSNKSQPVDLGHIHQKQKRPSTAASAPARKLPSSLPTTSGINKRSLAWGQKKTKDRHVEEQTLQADPVNVGERATLSKSRKQVAAKKYKSNDRANHIIDRITEDLLQHRGTKSVFQVRKPHWKREFSEISSAEFADLWKKAKTKFKQIIASGDGDERGQQTASKGDDENTSKKRSSTKPPAVGLSSAPNTEEHGCTNNKDVYKTIEMIETNGNVDLFGGKQGNDGSGVVMEEYDIPSPRPPKRPLINRWNHLFLGPSFKIDQQFTLNEFEEEL